MAPGKSSQPSLSHVLRQVRGLPRVILASLLLLAILNLLIGVFLRYVMVRVSDWFDLPSINFFWVEEVGEFTLAWLSLIGAAVGIAEGVHFTIGALTQRLPPRLRAALYRTLHGLVACFGIAAAFSGWQLTLTNRELTSPGLGINLALLYVSAVIGGILIAVYGVRSALAPIPAASDLGEKAG
jgi:TRAP-type C4-dicarboxylate transport system permease small subunit